MAARFRMFPVNTGVSASPVWSTAANLGTFSGFAPYSQQFAATSPISAPVVYSVVGSLPEGLALSGNTVSGGIKNPMASQEVRTFTLRAATGTQYSDRTFSMTVNRIASADPYADYVVYYYKADGTYTDTSFSNRSIDTTNANTNMQVVTSGGKFSGALEFRGSSMLTTQDMRIPAHPDLNVGTSDFTLEWQARASATQAQYSVWLVSAVGPVGSTINEDTPNGISIFAQPANTNKFSFKCGAGGARATTISPNDNVWRHYAIVRSGNVIKLYVDGLEELSYDYTGEVDFGAAYGIRLGNWNGRNTGNHYRGFLDELRLTKAARYLGPFTPQTAAFVYP